MNKISNLLWGLIFIIVGVIFGLNALDITNIDIFFDGWWTLFIIIPCFCGLFKDEDKSGNLIGLIIGLCLLLGCLDFINFHLIWKLIVPIILIIIGLSIIFKDLIHHNFKKEIKKVNKDGCKEYCAIFGGQTVNFANEDFSGCSLNAIFGGIKCDLKDAKIKKDIAINASAIFGGITIYVPDDFNIKISSTPIFGGVSDERKNKSNDSKNTIYINATSVFGGIVIK